MKVVICKGGLGNQMFQYALYLALKEKGKKVRFEIALYNQVRMHNGYELKQCFNIMEPNLRSQQSSIFLRLILRLNPAFLIFRDNLFFNKNVFLTKKKYLDGYWQSELYFKNIEKKIRNSFAFQHIDSRNMRIAAEMRSCTSISLHLRRGDYVNNNFYYDICKSDYYSRAIELMINKLENSSNVFFYVFSNDEDFANEFLKDLNINGRVINFNKDSESSKDMFLMSCCKHNIIANSSFSWWGAWLNSSPEKVVIAPERWFQNDNLNKSKDIVPETWTKI